MAVLMLFELVIPVIPLEMMYGTVNPTPCFPLAVDAYHYDTGRTAALHQTNALSNMIHDGNDLPVLHNLHKSFLLLASFFL